MSERDRFRARCVRIFEIAHQLPLNLRRRADFMRRRASIAVHESGKVFLFDFPLDDDEDRTA
jgi:hypothetical protein